MPRDSYTLARTQSALASLITGRAAGRKLPDPASFIVGDARASADERVAVYAFMYRDRLIEALASQFPRVASLLGSDAFADRALAYLADVPSTHPSLRFLGAGFPSCIARQGPGNAGLAGLAALEWARADIFDAEDETALGVDTVRAWPPEHFAELPTVLINAHRLISVAAGTAALWRKAGPEVEADRTLGQPSTAGSPLAMETLLVWRQDLALYHRVVDAGEAEALALVAAGTKLGRVCDVLAAKHDEQDAVAQAFAWLWTWASDGILAAG